MGYKKIGCEGVGKPDGYYQRANGTRVSAYTMRCDLSRPPPPDHRARSWR